MASKLIDRFAAPALSDFFPKMDYGQGANKAWSPQAWTEVYQMAERARADEKLAQGFAADIIMAKESTGRKVYDLTGREHKTEGYLKNKHSLNASESWAGQAFGAPAVKGKDGNWYSAYSQLDMVTGTRTVRVGGRDGESSQRTTYAKGGAGGFGFVQGERITDSEMLRQLNEGVYAFSAKGANGQTVYVPFAAGKGLQKGGGGRPEAGNYKKNMDASAAPEAPARTAWNVSPGVVGDPLGLKQTLLGGATGNATDRKSKTLLG